MELIERYVHAVIRHLPESQRGDVAKELRASIEDMAHEYGGGSVTEDSVAKALTKLGNPAVLARDYQQGPSYLIGPAVFPLYKESLIKVVGIVTPIILIVLAVLGVFEGDSLTSVIGQAIGGALQVALHIFFWMTLVFFLLERGGLEKELGEATKGKSWTPADLPALPPRRQINLVESIASIFCTALLLAALFASRDLIGIHRDGDVVPFFHPDLWKYWLPGLILVTAFSLAQEVAKAKIGRWTAKLTAAEVALNVASVAFLVAFASQTVINPAFIDAATALAPAKDAANVVQWINWTAGITFAVAVAAYAYNTVEALFKYRIGRKAE